LLTKSYNLDLRKFGWRTADLLIAVDKGKANETAQKLLADSSTNVISASLRIGHPQTDIMAGFYYRDSIELHSLVEKIKTMLYVQQIEWTEVVKLMENNIGAMIDR
jgi:hypothetical protein